jgi:hypothetical protein
MRSAKPTFRNFSVHNPRETLTKWPFLTKRSDAGRTKQFGALHNGAKIPQKTWQAGSV